jgi:hypothetical protein
LRESFIFLVTGETKKKKKKINHYIKIVPSEQEKLIENDKLSQKIYIKNKGINIERYTKQL